MIANKLCCWCWISYNMNEREIDKPICACAWKHLVDTEHVVRVYTYTDVERIFTDVRHKVFVCANTSCFKSLGTQLFTLIWKHVSTEGELLNTSSLLTNIVETNLGICTQYSKKYQKVWFTGWAYSSRMKGNIKKSAGRTNETESKGEQKETNLPGTPRQ